MTTKPRSSGARNRAPKKLQLAKETLRDLTDRDAAAKGGRLTDLLTRMTCDVSCPTCTLTATAAAAASCAAVATCAAR